MFAFSHADVGAFFGAFPEKAPVFEGQTQKKAPKWL